MKTRFSIFSLALMMGGILGVAQCVTAATPKVGDKAPLVEGTTADGKAWKLADLIGKKVVVLYFYPKDDTPGCTREACGWRDSMSQVTTNGAAVVGVSFDSVESHQKFIAKHNLNFPLVADTEGKIAEAYGVRWSGGRAMARRVSFVIGLDGTVLHVTDSPVADAHLIECKAVLERAGKK